MTMKPRLYQRGERNPKTMDREPLRETLRWFRGNKQMTRTARIQVGGRLRKEDAAIAAQITARMQRMQQTHAAWVRKRLAGLQGYLGDIASEAVEEACYGGFQVLLRRQVRYWRKTTPASLGSMQAPSYQRKMITGFTLDFFRSLQIAARLDIAPETAVKIARRSYIHPPDIVLHLQQAYPQFGQWIAIRAVAIHDDPEGFLRQVEAKRTALKRAFPVFEEWVIHRAAVYHKDSHGYLRWVQEMVKRLEAQPEFKGFQPVAIREAVVCHRRPEAYLKRIKKKASRLQARFPDFDPEVILAVSLRHKKPAQYLRDLARKLPDLIETFPGIKPSRLVEAFMRNENFEADFRRLKQKFPHRSDKSILNALIQYPTRPEYYLRRKDLFRD